MVPMLGWRFYGVISVPFHTSETIRKHLLFLGGRISLINSYTKLVTAAEHEVLMFCPSSHTTISYNLLLDHSLQNFNKACHLWILANEKTKISGLGKLLFRRWTGAAMVQNWISGFQATRIVPLEKSVIPEHILYLVQWSNTPRKWQRPRTSACNEVILKTRLRT